MQSPWQPDGQPEEGGCRGIFYLNVGCSGGRGVVGTQGHARPNFQATMPASAGGQRAQKGHPPHPAPSLSGESQGLKSKDHSLSGLVQGPANTADPPQQGTVLKTMATSTLPQVPHKVGVVGYGRLGE